jgi:hypothetical protein
VSEVEDGVREVMQRMAQEVHPHLALPPRQRRRIRRRQGLMATAATTVLAVVVGGAAVVVVASRHTGTVRPLRTGPAATGSIPSHGLSTTSLPKLATACVSGWAVADEPLTQPHRGVALVAAAGAAYNDVWSVGTSFPSNPSGLGNPSDALIEHWDGRRWTVVPGADLAGRSSSLAAVVAPARDDVWVVGSRYGSDSRDPRLDPLIEHWDGRHWSLVEGAPAPPGVSPRLVGIAAVRPDDVWVHGWDSPVGATESVSRDLYEHWDGRRWSFFGGPQAVSRAVGLAATQVISVDSSGDAWAAGGKIRGFGAGGQPAGSLVERWNGSAWVEVPAPPGTSAVGALAVVGPGDVWAVTGSGLRTASGAYGATGPRRFVHWNGTTWTASAPAEGVGAMAAKGPADVWAVGSTSGIPSQVVVLHWDGSRWGTIDTHPPGPAASPGTSFAGLASISVAADGTVVGFGSDASRQQTDPATTSPQKRLNYLWTDCGR